MSVLRPKDGDYITRGVFLLLGWSIVGWAPFATVGALLAGAGGAAVGLGVSIPIGVALYWVYLERYPRRRSVPADGEILDAPGAKDADESFDEYAARMKVEFSAAKVYSATRDRPAVSTYTRKSSDLQEKLDGS